MRTRIALATLVLALSIGIVSLTAQQTAPPQIGDWPAPAFWQPPSHASGDRVRLAPQAAISAPLPFVPITPCRMLDTRSTGGPIASGSTRDVALTGPPCGIPSGAAAVSANFAVFNIAGTSSTGVLLVYPTGSPSGSQAMVNWSSTSGQIDNASVVPLGTGGSITVQPNQGAGTIDLVIDVNGYYGGSVVTSLNNLFGDVTLAPGSNVTITPSGQTLTVAATSGPGGVLPTGTAGQTLRHNGTAWVANSALTSDGTDVALTGTLALPSAVRVTSGGNPFLHTFGTANTFAGQNAGNFTTTGSQDTAIGSFALLSNTTGGANTANGYSSLRFNTTGQGNTAIGNFALENNIAGSSNTATGNAALRNNTGSFETAIGALALGSNTSGDSNTAVGYTAIGSNTTGSGNTAIGAEALFKSIMGNNNTAIGRVALYSNTTGSLNTALGDGALYLNNTGERNVAIGRNALEDNTTGSINTAIGPDVLINNSTGSNNIAIGFAAGSSLTTGSNNICIGADGSAGEAGTIRIGNINHMATYIAGISGKTSSGGVGVFVNVDGKLGTTTSSRRFKEEIREIAGESDGLMRLRPVAFKYKPEIDPTGLAQYGLIAEEVAEVYPDLVAFDREGRPETVRYHLISALLLNEVQKQHRTNEVQERGIERQKRIIEALEGRLAELEAQHAESRRITVSQQE